MKISFYCPLWGMNNLSAMESLLKIKKAGYDGVEFGFPSNDPRAITFLNTAKELELDIIAQQYDAKGHVFQEYKATFEDNLYYLTSFKPAFINSQTGKDYFTFEENCTLIETASSIEKQTSVSIIHETHRGKFPFSVSTTLKFINTFPDLRFTADFSHFCTVSESYLEDQFENLHHIIKRGNDIHARVGHPQGPQVTDPTLNEWQDALTCHLHGGTVL